MTSIYSYQKFIAREVTRTLNTFSPGLGAAAVITELATIDGLTYVSVPEGVSLPKNQPEEISGSIKPVTLTDSLIEAIKSTSPHCRLINDRVIEMIRNVYSPNDEQYFSRIGIGAALNIYEFQDGERDMLLQFGAYVEECRNWGRQQRAALGL
jgi:hypothetical protein